MSRGYANVFTDIWRDPGFRGLDARAQRAFLMLYTQADITAAGVLSLTLRRWSNLAVDTTVTDLEAGLAALEQHGFAVVDYDTEELLLVPFVRWDKGYNNVNRRPVILREAAAVQSRRIGWALVEEFKALGLPLEGLPDAPPNPPPPAPPPEPREAPPPGVPAGHPVGPTDGPSDAPANGPAGGPSTSDGVVVTTEGKSLPTPNPHSANRNPSQKQASARARQERAARMPDDFVLDDLMAAYASKRGMSSEVARREFEAFCAYHGSKGNRYVDWRKAWQTWVHRWAERNRPAQTSSRPEHFG